MVPGRTLDNAAQKIVIGIPSYNEGRTINYVTRQADLGLKAFFPAADSLIINTDSDSTDNTKEAFCGTQTSAPKKYVNTGKKPRGKGKNLIALFEYCANLDVDYVAVLDSDVTTIQPSWVRSLINPLMTRQCDYTAPVYARSCYDGNVTNHFAYPLTRAVFGVELQQPIGGEFGLNKRMYKYLLRQPVTETELGFGIDIFMTFHAIGGGLKVCEVSLGKKVHKPGLSTLEDKFLQISQSAIAVSRRYRRMGRSAIRHVEQAKSIRVFKPKRRPDKMLVSRQMEKFAREIEKNLPAYKRLLGRELTHRIARVVLLHRQPEVSSVLWIDALSRLLRNCYGKGFNAAVNAKTSRLLAPLLYWRAVSFWEEIQHLTPEEITEKIQSQARLLSAKLQ
ncbi:MAG: glycosyl transferase [Parcubacteria group bacterium Gr01-1014_38]|nr:MAG: glycosyl transferase [Parcubacteria group bacterium Gr01-1014_38]